MLLCFHVSFPCSLAMWPERPAAQAPCCQELVQQLQGDGMWPDPTTMALMRQISVNSEWGCWMWQAVRPLFRLQDVTEMKGFLGREVACVKEICFLLSPKADGRMCPVLPEDAVSNQVELCVEVSVFIQRHLSPWHLITYVNICWIELPNLMLIAT